MSNLDIASNLRGTAVSGADTRPPAVRRLRDELPALIAVLFVLVGMVWLLAGNSFLLSVLSMTLLFAGLATAWNIIGGLGGQFSMAHSVFFAIGAYTAGNLYLHWGISPWIGLVPAAALAAAVSALVSWPVFRLRGPFFAIATMAMTEVALAVAIYARPITGGAGGMTVPWRAGFQNMIFTSKWAGALLFVGFLAVALVVMISVTRSRLGYYLQAVRDNESAALASGIHVLRVKLIGMAISAAVTAAGGVVFMMYVRIVEPEGLLSLFDIGVKIVLITLIGGIGRIYGPLLGAALIVPLDFWLRALGGSSVPGGAQIVLGGILVLAALFLKHGISGALRSALPRNAGRSA